MPSLLRFIKTIIAGSRKKSAASAIKIVIPVKKPKFTKWFREANMRIKKPVHRTSEVIRSARPVPNSVSRTASYGFGCPLIIFLEVVDEMNRIIHNNPDGDAADH